jgi:hypothetical protein
MTATRGDEVPNYRVDFKRPHDANPKRKAKVFTFTIAKDERAAAEKIMRHHPGSEIVSVTEEAQR